VGLFTGTGSRYHGIRPRPRVIRLGGFGL
jgi:hypothetical protein